MKAFSKIPDPFDQNIEIGRFEIPFHPVFQIDAIPQGRMYKNVYHLINNQSIAKERVLSLDLSQQLKEKESINTGITQRNLASKQLDFKQMPTMIQKGKSQQSYKIGNVFSCENLEIEGEEQKIVEIQNVRKLQQSQSPQKQTFNSLPLESNSKNLVSHIVFSIKPQYILGRTFEKRPIFLKKNLKIESMNERKISIQKDSVEQKILQVQRKEPEKVRETQIVQQKPNLDGTKIESIEEKLMQVQQHIQCSFFGNSTENHPNDRDNTGFGFIQSVVKIFTDKSMSQISQKLYEKGNANQRQTQGRINMTFLNKKDQLKKIGRDKLNGSKILQKVQAKLGKFDIIEIKQINPVFF